MRYSNKKRLGDLLVENNKITEDQLKAALAKQKQSGFRIGDILVSEGMLTEEDIISVLEIQLGIQRAFLDFISVEEKAVKSIPESLANKYNLIPVYIKNGKLCVVMADPLNLFALDDIKMVSGYEIEPMIATEAEIKKAISKYYSKQYIKKAADDLNKEQTKSKISISGLEENDTSVTDINNAPVVRLVDSVIDNAIKARASDIHIEPFEKYVKIRYRVDGELHEVLRSPIDTLGALITRIKILANMNIAEKRIPQDGRILTKIGEKSVDLRVSVLPTVYGEKTVIRILTKDNSLIGKEKLGMNSDDMEKLERIMKNPNGIILVTGPTGSGKSTTLYTILNELNTEDKNIITVEDPVEYMLEGVNQVSVNVKAGLTFASGLRSILRQDPDIIMIGEIRDTETAEIAVRSAITGHLVLSTIHTNDAPSSIVRLADMDVEPYLIASSLTGAIAQRLVRRLCSNCSEEYEATEYEKQILGKELSEKVMLHKGAGCPFCNNTGYKGRIGIYEVMEITREHRDLIMKNGNIDAIRDLSLKHGMKTLKMSCEELVLQGVTTIDELMKVAYLKE